MIASMTTTGRPDFRSGIRDSDWYDVRFKITHAPRDDYLLTFPAESIWAARTLIRIKHILLKVRYVHAFLSLLTS